MTAARTRLLLDFPWYGSLAMRLKVEPDENIKTFQTDGTRLAYNPAALDAVTDLELTGIIAHEVMHCALLHPFRRGSRNAQEWNEATDYAVNAECARAGLKLPDGCLIDPQYDGLSAEVIYAQRAKQKRQNEQNQQQQPQQQPQPQGGQGAEQNPEPITGTVVDAPPAPAQVSPDPDPNGSASGQQPQPAPQPMTESDWKIAAEQATDVARGCGKLPAGIDRAVKMARTETADWRATLREFVEHTTPSDYSWMSPNRRYISDGLYLPGIVKENLGKLAFAVDTSGSINTRQLAAVAAELQAIVSECRPDLLVVIYSDAAVRSTQEFSADDEITLNAKGGGGTRFKPVFDMLNTADEPPVCLIYFTDLDATDKKELTQPDYPVLWCTDLSVTENGPFGETMRIVI
jgi:predicted metal-dependent peptidase